ncbi:MULTISPECIES: aminodeoxychorismate synthase component I [Pseudomonadati]|uniref:aminodeoxychorismate synthase n=1 Tax=Shewanella aestuarii TaxID=1028752 RepID=A0ABT0KXC1_9GAMM|nr:aminodeoxychorismate synthase component I [Shewanella aestuarii]MCL1116112.1 aminodeoxychorismate synthase component I [Shewanella aestuarii]GGN70500.1 aminodeoxychorismate synthase, component I [Shewanella aestuarii]
MKQRGDKTLTITPLMWAGSTQSLFEYVSHLPWAMLLDSANAQHQDARFDIITFNPIATLVSRNGKVIFEAKDRANKTLQPIFETIADHLQTTSLDPLAALKYCQQQLYPVKQACQYPFSGGAMGAFSYDLGRSIEQLPNTAAKDIDFNELNIGFYDQCLVYDYQQQNWSLISYDNIDHNNPLVNVINKRSPLLNLSDKPAFCLTSEWRNQTPKQTYLNHFERVQDYLLSGDCYQINLTQRFEADYQGDEWQAYKQLTQANKAPFSAFIRLPNHSVLSISPERFIQLAGDNIETKPIKGTLPRLNDAALDVLQADKLRCSEKDRAENVMIVDLLRNDIGKVATSGSVKVPKLFNIESFPAVHHLVSTVTAKLAAQYDASDLLKACFPGGSITGAPKIRAMQIIEELEPSRRSMYCGSIGYLSQDGTMDTSITIRTLVTENSRIYCWAGGGVVADSNAEAEYQECFDKVSKILPLLQSTKR